MVRLLHITNNTICDMTLSDVVLKKNTRNHDSKYRHITNNTSDYHAIIDFGSFDLSIVQNDRDYGNNQNQFQIVVFGKDGATELDLPNIPKAGYGLNTPSYNSWLTFTDLDSILRQLEFEALAVHKFKPRQVQ